MDLLEAIQKRHSVRSYTTKRLDITIANELTTFIDDCNAKSGLHIQLCLNEPNAFNSFLARYGSFKNVMNYIAIVGAKEKRFEEICGYWGERIVLKATQLGLSTCWVGVTYSKRKSACKVNPGEKLCCVIALGYGETDGVPHKSKPLESVCKVDGKMPEWFKKGMEAALLAPTALNQQKFFFTLQGNIVTAKSGYGSYTKLDLGIVKSHFEIGAGDADWTWVL